MLSYSKSRDVEERKGREGRQCTVGSDGQDSRGQG